MPDALLFWWTFVARVSACLDATRAGKIVVVATQGGPAVLVNPRTRPGPAVKRTLSSTALREERRQVLDVLRDGGAVALTRWGVVDGVLWTVAAEEAWLRAREKR